jgi:hypothetical protein
MTMSFLSFEKMCIFTFLNFTINADVEDVAVSIL